MNYYKVHLAKGPFKQTTNKPARRNFILFPEDRIKKQEVFQEQNTHIFGTSRSVSIIKSNFTMKR